MINNIFKHMKSRITVLVGAGACIDINGPSTEFITNQVKNIKLDTMNQSNEFISNICSMLDKYYKADCWNFEDFFHTLEILSSQLAGWRPNTIKKYKPAIGGFVQAINNEVFNSLALIESKQKVIEKVAQLINEYDSSFNPEGKDQWFSDFWKNLNKKAFLDITTLNYDTCIEQCLTDYQDGYEKIESNCHKFNPRLLVKKNKSRIMHLHGCINYGYFWNEGDPNKYVFIDDFQDLYKYDRYSDSRVTWFGRSGNSAQSGDNSDIGPIITGLRKTDKIIAYPYSEYYSVFQNSLINNSKLLIIGYSFGDKHFNKIINRISGLHGSNRKIVIITYCNPNDWCHDPTCMDNFNQESIEFLAKSFMEFNPFNGYYDFKEKIISKDKNVRIYFSGFKKTVLKYDNEIIDFLNK